MVWYGDGDNPFDYEIYGQIIDANGDPVVEDFQISNVDTPGNLARIGLDPAVAYNSQTNQYLVIWYGDALPTDNEYEVWGQLVSATGTEVGSDFRISNMGDDNSVSRTALRDPEVTYNATSNEYLAVWSGNNMNAFEKYEIWGQRITATGTPVTGTAESGGQCTDSTDSDGDGLINDGCPANGPAETRCVNSLDDEQSPDTPDGLVNDGCPVNSDFRISQTGGDGDPARDADNPVVATNTSNGQYMVAWYGNPVGAAGEYEIYGQVLSQAGAEVGGDFRISNVGPDGNGLYEPGPVPPAIAYNSTDNAVSRHLVRQRRSARPLRTTRSSASACLPPVPRWAAVTSGSRTSAQTATPPSILSTQPSPTTPPTMSTSSPGTGTSARRSRSAASGSRRRGRDRGRHPPLEHGG